MRSGEPGWVKKGPARMQVSGLIQRNDQCRPGPALRTGLDLEAPAAVGETLLNTEQPEPALCAVGSQQRLCIEADTIVLDDNLKPPTFLAETDARTRGLRVLHDVAQEFPIDV